jgi:hypothetical protein
MRDAKRCSSSTIRSRAFKFHVLLQQAVRPDDDVDGACPDLLTALLICVCARNG